MVGLLLGINVGVIPELGLSMTAAKVIPGAMLTTGATAAVSLDQTPILAAEHALKATVSTLMMGGLAAGATAAGHFVGRRADADWLAAVFGAVRRAALLLRAGTSPASETLLTELTGIRRRTIARTGSG
ncbi:hypothetical protein [Roseateles noduli]|uniref:hypothetical protein n=1 Tax=Roseateles noduli TaxID=2052484 RepID=UPI003D64F23B